MGTKKKEERSEEEEDFQEETINSVTLMYFAFAFVFFFSGQKFLTTLNFGIITGAAI